MKTTIEKNFDALAKVMHSITGVTPEVLRGRSRRYPLVYYRGMIAEQLWRMGYDILDISVIFDRSQAAIVYGISNLSTLILPSHRVDCAVYELFKQKCKKGGLTV